MTTVADRELSSLEAKSSRRSFFGATAAGVAATSALLASNGALSQTAAAPTETDVFNFALNFEYLGAEFYLRASSGTGLSDADTTGTGTRGAVTGGRQLATSTNFVAQFVRELARDELQHVRFLRSVLGSAAIARPAIDLSQSFTTFARAAGIVGSTGTFDPFADENSFLVGAFILEDVCVTALKGASPLIRNSQYLESAAGLLATEAYHAGVLRFALYDRGLYTRAKQVSDLRDFFDGPTNLDEGIGDQNFGDLVPNDANAIAFSRTPDQVLAVAYGSGTRQPGGFFPNGTNGTIR